MIAPAPFFATVGDRLAEAGLRPIFAHPELSRAVARRPAEELFDIRKDPECLHNLAGNPEYASVQQQLSSQLTDYLKQTGDARVTGKGDIWETYPRNSDLRWFPAPDWAVENPESVPKQDWVEQARPRVGQ